VRNNVEYLLWRARHNKHQQQRPWALLLLSSNGYDDDDDGHDADDNKPVWPLGLWALSSEGVRNISM
jgi:hypothetical protein